MNLEHPQLTGISELKYIRYMAHRKILNSSLPMDTQNLQLHTDHFPVKKTSRLAEELLTTKDKRATLWSP